MAFIVGPAAVQNERWNMSRQGRWATASLRALSRRRPMGIAAAATAGSVSGLTTSVPSRMSTLLSLRMKARRSAMIQWSPKSGVKEIATPIANDAATTSAGESLPTMWRNQCLKRSGRKVVETGIGKRRPPPVAHEADAGAIVDQADAPEGEPAGESLERGELAARPREKQPEVFASIESRGERVEAEHAGEIGKCGVGRQKRGLDGRAHVRCAADAIQIAHETVRHVEGRRGEPPGGERGAELELRARIDLMADEPRLLGRARRRDAPPLRVENVLLRGKTVAGLEQSETGGPVSYTH